MRDSDEYGLFHRTAACNFHIAERTKHLPLVRINNLYYNNIVSNEQSRYIGDVLGVISGQYMLFTFQQESDKKHGVTYLRLF